MFRLETDLGGVSITRLGVGANEKGHNCTLLYVTYKRARPIPDINQTADNCLTLWTKPFVTRNNGLTHISLWEPGVLYRLPRIALAELMGGDDLCAAPIRIDFQHTPYSGFAVDEYNRGSADGERITVTTALHVGAHTPCIVAPRDRLVNFIDCFSSRTRFSPFFNSEVERRGVSLSWLTPLLCTEDVRIEHLPGLLDRPVELTREEVSRETA